jgi:hypothetical protein
MKWSFDNLVPISDLECVEAKKVELLNHSPTSNSSAISITALYTPAMIQRSLLRASRSVNTKLPSRTFTSLRTASPFLRSQSISPSSLRIASRWYSDAAPAKEEAKPDEAAKTESTEVETLKKDLEAKNKEIIDLKVCPPSRPPIA